MLYLTEERYLKRLDKIQRKNQHIEYRNKLREEKNKYKKQFKLPSTSKLILVGTVLLCTQIVAFCEYAMMYFCNLEAMYALIGVPAALMPVVWAYFSKAKAENTAGGITYELAMKKNDEAKG